MKKARVLLVTPNLKVNEGELSRMQPSLGLMIFAQMLIDQGHKVKICDFALDVSEQNFIYKSLKVDLYNCSNVLSFGFLISPIPLL